MNRRSFIDAIIKASAAAAVLPSAKTYARIWTPPRRPLVYRSSDIGVMAQLEQCGVTPFAAFPFQDAIAEYLTEYMKVAKRNLIELVVHKDDLPRVREQLLSMV